MPIENIIKLLRQSIFIQDPDISVVDEDLLQMADEDFIPLLTMCLGRVDSSATLDNMKSDRIYPLILLTKIELYHRLAVKSASTYSLTSATGVQLSRGEIFEHYYQLIQQTKDEYSAFMSTGGLTLSSEDVVVPILLDSRYFSERNYKLATRPSIKLNLDNFYSTSCEISWGGFSVTKFARFNVYVGKRPIFDKYTDSIDKEAKKIIEIKDIHKTLLRIADLTPDTKYYVLIELEDRNGLKGYSQIEFTTLAVE